jgi:hypothetical protein
LNHEIHRRYFVAVSALVVSTLSFAQNSNQPVTRSQVNAELAAFDSVGYTASGHQLTYPKDIQAAEAKTSRAPRWRCRLWRRWGQERICERVADATFPEPIDVRSPLKPERSSPDTGWFCNGATINDSGPDGRYALYIGHVSATRARELRKRTYRLGRAERCQRLTRAGVVVVRGDESVGRRCLSRCIGRDGQRLRRLDQQFVLKNKDQRPLVH